MNQSEKLVLFSTTQKHGKTGKRKGNSQEGLLPQGQASPLTGWFSVAALSQVHCPAGRAPSRSSQFDLCPLKKRKNLQSRRHTA